jgi:predicted PurR-regulated permease PerM
MRKLFIILGFTAAISAVVIALTKSYNLALAPIIMAFISGIIVIYLSKKQNTAVKTIQYVFLFVIIALSLTIYKSIVTSENFKNIAQQEYSDNQNLTVSKETLDNN